MLNDMNHEHLEKFAHLVEKNPSEGLRLSFYCNQGNGQLFKIKIQELTEKVFH